MGESYTYTIEFTISSVYPWKWTVYLNGEVLTEYPNLGYTGLATTLREAKRRVKRYIRQHRKYHDMVIQG